MNGMDKRTDTILADPYPAFRGDKVKLLYAMMVGADDDGEVLARLQVQPLQVHLLLLLHLDKLW